VLNKKEDNTMDTKAVSFSYI